MIDSYLNVQVLSKTNRPNLVAYLALHQCYSENMVSEELNHYSSLDESELGRRVVDKCIKYGHWSVIEHPSITFLVEGFPHDTIMQARTHRHLSFSVQSQRYTGERIVKLVELGNRLETDVHSNFKQFKTLLEDSVFCDRFHHTFYVPPIDIYIDREGNKLDYNEEKQLRDSFVIWQTAKEYFVSLKELGYAPEHARRMLAQAIRQSCVVSGNARAWLHFCDLRTPKDAQGEIRKLALMIFAHFKEWMPEVATWYENNRLGKNKLAP